MKMKLSRVYRRYQDWEEVKHNMWGHVEDVKLYLEKAVLFTGNHKLYGAYMERVSLEWPISCENALTDMNINRKAWLGHAACALAINCPEDITRKAWRYLSDEQQINANAEAERVISKWELNYIKSNTIY